MEALEPVEEVKKLEELPLPPEVFQDHVLDFFTTRELFRLRRVGNKWWNAQIEALIRQRFGVAVDAPFTDVRTKWLTLSKPFQAAMFHCRKSIWTWKQIEELQQKMEGLNWNQAVVMSFPDQEEEDSYTIPAHAVGDHIKKGKAVMAMLSIAVSEGLISPRDASVQAILDGWNFWYGSASYLIAENIQVFLEGYVTFTQAHSILEQHGYHALCEVFGAKTIQALRDKKYKLEDFFGAEGRERLALVAEHYGAPPLFILPLGVKILLVLLGTVLAALAGVMLVTIVGVLSGMPLVAAHVTVAAYLGGGAGMMGAAASAGYLFFERPSNDELRRLQPRPLVVAAPRAVLVP